MSPGNFYDPARKLNIVDLNTGYKYIYTLGYTVTEAINKREQPCKWDLSWRQDQCKMSRVRRIDIKDDLPQVMRYNNRREIIS